MLLLEERYNDVLLLEERNVNMLLLEERYDNVLLLEECYICYRVKFSLLDCCVQHDGRARP